MEVPLEDLVAQLEDGDRHQGCHVQEKVVANRPTRQAFE